MSDDCGIKDDNEDFLPDEELLRDPNALPDGVQKVILNEGRGHNKPKEGDEVSVHYVGTLQADASEFDSSRARDKLFVFTLGQGQVIKGWDVGVATMREGETAKFTLAPEFAYGDTGSPPKIPAKATLVFEVELLSWVSKDDLFGDGHVTKTQLAGGSGWKKPKENDEVQINLKVTTKDGKTRDERTGFEYVLGSGVLGPISQVVDFALEGMSKEEQVSLECSKDYSYGKETPDGVTIVLTLLQIYEIVDVSLAKNKSLMKKQIVEGEGWEKPSDCATVKLQVSAATDGSSDLPGFTAKTLEFTAGNGEVCDAIECAVTEMKLKEKSVLTCTDHLLASEAQLGLKGVSAKKVVLTLELLELEKAKDSWKMDEEEKVVHGIARKDAGSNLFRAGRTRMALERYKKVINLFTYVDNYKEENKQKVKDLKKACELNSAACQLKFQEFAAAKTHCNNVLKDDSSNLKALFRRAQAHLGLKDFEQCIADCKKHIELEPQGREARSLLKEALNGQKEEDKKSKGMFSKMCQGLGKGPIPEPVVLKSFVPPDRPSDAIPELAEANAAEASASKSDGAKFL